MMNFKIKHLKDFLSGNYKLLHKSFGVELVELGFLTYKKLTEENYNYWFCEVLDISQMDKKHYTYEWNDLIQTRKLELMKAVLPFYNENESIHKLVTAVLNIEAADGYDIETGESEKAKLVELYYGKRARIPVQLQLEFYN